MNRAELVRKITEIMPITERLVCLAEEASELAQAALKYRRTLIDTNPTPMLEEEAYDKLMEEIADVELCLETLYTNDAFINLIMNQKAERWLRRLENRDES